MKMNEDKKIIFWVIPLIVLCSFLLGSNPSFSQDASGESDYVKGQNSVGIIPGRTDVLVVETKLLKFLLDNSTFANDPNWVNPLATEAESSFTAAQDKWAKDVAARIKKSLKKAGYGVMELPGVISPDAPIRGRTNFQQPQPQQQVGQ